MGEGTRHEKASEGAGTVDYNLLFQILYSINLDLNWLYNLFTKPCFVVRKARTHFQLSVGLKISFSIQVQLYQIQVLHVQTIMR